MKRQPGSAHRLDPTTSGPSPRLPQMRLSAELKAALEEAARRDHRPLASYIRVALMEHLEQRGFYPQRRKPGYFKNRRAELEITAPPLELEPEFIGSVDV